MLDTYRLSFGRIIYERLLKRADEVVIINSDDQPVTANQLLERVRAAASELARQNVNSADRVVICVVDNVDALICLIACWYLSATPVLIDFRTPASQRRNISNLVSAKYIIEDRHPKGADDYDYIMWDDIRHGTTPIKTDFPSSISCSSGQ